jgi:hypothetical protein
MIRRTAVAAAVLLLGSASAVSGIESGAILLFSDPAYTSCSIVDVADEEYTVYIVHVDDNGVVGSQFNVANESNLVYVGEDLMFIPIGMANGGVSIAYPECLSGEIFLGTITYQGTGMSPACAYLIITPFFLAYEVEGINCSNQKVDPARGRLIVNPDETCQCISPVPVEETSWGRVKALYD